MSWAQFLKRHWEVFAATDFFTVEVATWHGPVTYYVLVVMELATRRVILYAALDKTFFFDLLATVWCSPMTETAWNV
jgi:hypothetical protein